MCCVQKEARTEVAHKCSDEREERTKEEEALDVFQPTADAARADEETETKKKSEKGERCCTTDRAVQKKGKGRKSRQKENLHHEERSTTGNKRLRERSVPRCLV